MIKQHFNCPSCKKNKVVDYSYSVYYIDGGKICCPNCDKKIAEREGSIFRIDWIFSDFWKKTNAGCLDCNPLMKKFYMNYLMYDDLENLQRGGRYCPECFCKGRERNLAELESRSEENPEKQKEKGTKKKILVADKPKKNKQGVIDCISEKMKNYWNSLIEKKENENNPAKTLKNSPDKGYKNEIGQLHLKNKSSEITLSESNSSSEVYLSLGGIALLIGLFFLVQLVRKIKPK